MGVPSIGEAMTSPNENRLSLIVFFLFILSFLFFSCSSTEVKTAEGPGESAARAGDRRDTAVPGGDAKQKTGVAEREGSPQKAIEAESIPVSKEAQIKLQMKSEVETLEATPIYFEFDKSELSPDAQVVLKKLAAWLQINQSYSVLIEGHCDERGPSGYNVVLGHSRAVAAEKFLQLLGIDAQRISSVSYGEEIPAVKAKNEEAWIRNRRDQFKLKADR